MEILSVSPELMGSVQFDLPITKNICELLFGILNGNIIGYLIVGKDSNGYNLEHLFIDEKHRRNGFGTKLLEICIDSYKRIKLIVSIDNRSAIRMYEKHGFKKWHVNGRYYVMQTSSPL